MTDVTNTNAARAAALAVRDAAAALARRLPLYYGSGEPADEDLAQAIEDLPLPDADTTDWKAEAERLRRERDELAADYSRLLEKHNALHITAKRSRDERVALTADLAELSASHAELAARLAEIEQAEPARQELTALERDLLEALQGAYSLAIGHAATYQHQHQLAAPHPTHAEILSQSRAAIAKASAPTADEPARADPQPRPTCATSGLLGATSGVGRECGMWIEGVCTSPEPCQHQQPVKPCRTCGPDACSDSTSCPRGER